MIQRVLANAVVVAWKLTKIDCFSSSAEIHIDSRDSFGTLKTPEYAIGWRQYGRLEAELRERYRQIADDVGYATDLAFR